MPSRSRAARAARLLPAGLLAVSALAVVPAAHAAPAPLHDPPQLDRGTWSDPPTSARVKYRWWMPGAYTDDGELENEVRQMRAAGAGGAEVVPMKTYGAIGATPDFLGANGWGTPRWSQKLGTMLAAAKANDFVLDQNLGPYYPPTVPTVADMDQPATQKKLLYGRTFVPGGTALEDAALPDPTGEKPPNKPDGTPAKKTLIAVVAARCKDDACADPVVRTTTLVRDTAVDITDHVEDGRVTWTPPAGGTWAIIPLWWTADGTKLSGYTSPEGYVLDHLSQAGAKAVTDYYDDHVLTPEIERLIRDTAKNGTPTFFEDSLELSQKGKWTPDLVTEWRRRRGYDPTTVLPAITASGRNGSNKPAFDFDDGSGPRIIEDFRRTWSDLYTDEYLGWFQRWAERHGSSMRAQAYGDPIDTSYVGSQIGVSEHESIAANNNAGGPEEAYRVVGTGAHLSGQPLVTSECCAVFGASYAQRMEGGTGDADEIGPEKSGMLAYAYQALSSGANSLLLHGFDYTAAPDSGWPGDHAWSPKSYDVSEAWGPRMPSWSDQRQVNDSLSRLQLVLQQGTPRLDVAVFYDDMGMKGTSNGYSTSQAQFAGDGALTGAGYTYEYMSPQFLRWPSATVRDGALFPDRSAYRAMVFNNQEAMDLESAEKLRDLARDGFPLVFVGKLPTRTPGGKAPATEDARLRSIVREILALEDQDGTKVAQVAEEADLPAALERLGVRASAAHAASPTVNVARRHTADTDYYFLYNRSDEGVKLDVTLAGRGTPFAMDSWTGRIDRLTRFDRTDGGVRVPVELAAHDQTVIAVSRADLDGQAPALQATATTADDAVYRDGALLARSTSGGDVETTIEDGRKLRTAVAAPDAPIALDRWTVDVESWRKGANGEPLAQTPLTPTLTTDTVAMGRFAVRAGTDGRLPHWGELGDGTVLKSIAGKGVYRTTVTLARGWDEGQGAWLDLGSANDTVRVRVNGTELPPVDQGNKNRIDVGPWLRKGENAIEVSVATPLINQLLVTPGSGYGPGEKGNKRAPTEVGLRGPARLTPYSQVAVREPAKDGDAPAPAPAPT
ncbi:glycosyl hydrolase, partial [Patulibacter sp. S7RM1-6]